MKIIKISSKIPSIVWVDSNNNVVYVKGLRAKPNRLTYHEFREVLGGGDKVQVTLPSGTVFKAPFRQLSDVEISTRLDEILGKL